MANIQLLDAALAAADADPAAYTPASWRCETGMCLAGWTVTVAGLRWAHPVTSAEADLVVDRDGKERYAECAARDLLGLAIMQADALFGAQNSREQLHAMRDVLAANPNAGWYDLSRARAQYPNFVDPDDEGEG